MQGFGNVGLNAAQIFQAHGHSVIAISDSKGGVYNEEGLNLEKLEEHKKKNGVLLGFEGGQDITNEELLEIKCDVLIPSALENVITKDNAGNVKASVILELANGPLSPEADEILFQRGIPVIPDILANSGGVTVSYFEWDQNLKNEHWSEKEVYDKLLPLMNTASDKTIKKARELKTSLRNGAFIVALERIQEKS